MPPRPSNFFEQLANVPVHYDRPPVAPYGSDGVARKFYGVPDLETSLDGVFKEIFALSPGSFGAPRVILSAGAYVNKPGQHGLGKAFDLDGIHWAQRSFIALDQRRDKLLYLAVQALCHKHFGTVLGFNYNAAHQDHLHLDIGRSVRFRETRSVTFFLQEALNTLFDQDLAVDGEYGPETEKALKAWRDSLGIGPLSQVGNWQAFLESVAKAAFDIVDQQPAPNSVAA